MLPCHLPSRSSGVAKGCSSAGLWLARFKQLLKTASYFHVLSIFPIFLLQRLRVFRNAACQSASPMKFHPELLCWGWCNDRTCSWNIDVPLFAFHRVLPFRSECFSPSKVLCWILSVILCALPVFPLQHSFISMDHVSRLGLELLDGAG